MPPKRSGRQKSEIEIPSDPKALGKLLDKLEKDMNNFHRLTEEYQKIARSKNKVEEK